MRNHSLTNSWALRILLILFILAIGVYLFIKPGVKVQKITPPEIPVTLEMFNLQQLTEQITPEGVAALISANTPFILINADDPESQVPSSPGPARLIYYSTTPSIRSVQNRINQDRQSKPTGFVDVIKLTSQRLTGTPLEWQRLGLTFFKNPVPTAPQLITPRQLSEAKKDNVDIQIIDLRQFSPGEKIVTPFPQAFRWLPHEVQNNLAKLSKEKWIVLIGYNNVGTQIIASELFQKGYLLTTVLDGGYPAWVNATDR